MSQRAPASVSIVCVYNDLAVRRDCLDRSLDEYLNPDNRDRRIEYIPVDNTDGIYRSAGAALNYGVSVAKNDVIAFVHQDVFLHSIDAVMRAAQELQSGRFGILGAIGISRDGRPVGSVRDRAILLGDPVAEPADVDSVDELLFMIPRRLVMHEPLTELPELAWHAYAVDYGLRVRKLGLRVGAAYIPVTHNSLTGNLSGLDVAHAHVATRYRDMLPVRTTCGVLTQDTISGSGRSPFSLLTSRARRIFSFMAAATRVRSYSHEPVVYADIRFELDGIVARAPGRRLCIINNMPGNDFTDDYGLLELKRLGNSILFAGRKTAELSSIIDQHPSDAWLVVANMTFQDMREVRPGFIRRQHVIGYHPSIGYWFLVGAGFSELPAHLRKRHVSLRRHLRRSGGDPGLEPRRWPSHRGPGNAAPARSVGTRTADDRGPGLPDDLQVKGERPVLDVAQVKP